MRLASDVLVGSSKFIQAVRALQEVYEVILIDCAPIGPVVDALDGTDLGLDLLHQRRHLLAPGHVHHPGGDPVIGSAEKFLLHGAGMENKKIHPFSLKNRQQ